MAAIHNKIIHTVCYHEMSIHEQSPVNTYRNLCLSECWWHVQIVWYENVPKVVPILDTPNGKPIDVVHRQIAGQLDLDVFALVAAQRLQWADLIGHFSAHDVWLRTGSDPEIRVRPGSIVVQIGNVEGPGVQYADVGRAESVRQSFEFG